MESKIYIQNGIENYELGKEILDKIEEYNIIENEKEFVEIIKSKELSYSEEKKYMFFGIKKGKFLKEYHLDKKFKGIKEEYYLSYENNCPLNCLYCYLRDYYNHGAFSFYVNFEDMFKELDQFNKKGVMISAGIVNDSFIFDKLTGASKRLIEYFKKRDDLNLELRTKTDNIDNLLEIEAAKNIIVSFTFNPDIVIKKYELSTATLEKRVNAAKKLQEKGYKIGLRLDPMIYVEDFDKRYGEMIEYIFENIDHSMVADIGVGALRYRKDLKEKVLKERQTDLFFNEMIIGIDGKTRYFKKIRLDMYKFVVKKIKEIGDFDIYIGMEAEYIWQEVFK